MKYGNVYRFWVKKRPESIDEKPSISPLLRVENGGLDIVTDYQLSGNVPPLGLLVGEYWYDERGILMIEVEEIYYELLAQYGQ